MVVDIPYVLSKMFQMVDEKEKTRREIEVLKQEVVKDLDAFRGEFQGITESLAAAKEATQESNAKLGITLVVVCLSLFVLDVSHHQKHDAKQEFVSGFQKNGDVDGASSRGSWWDRRDVLAVFISLYNQDMVSFCL